MRLGERDAGKKDDGAEIVEGEVARRQLALGQSGEGAVEEAEQRHRGPADKIDVGMQMCLLEALIDAHPDAEGKAEDPIEQPD